MTLAELKRRLQPGVKLQSIHVSTSGVVATHEFFKHVAVVSRNQRSGFAVKRPTWAGREDVESFCGWPPASCLQELPDGFAILECANGPMFLKYKWVD